MTPRMPPSQRDVNTAFVPSSREGLKAWRKAIVEHRQASARDLDGVVPFLTYWLEHHRGEEISTTDLTKLCLREGFFPYVLRKSIFGTRCTRLAEFLGRLALVQGDDGILPGVRFSRSELDRATRSRKWIIDAAGVLRGRVKAYDARSVATERAKDRETSADRRVLKKKSYKPQAWEKE